LTPAAAALRSPLFAGGSTTGSQRPPHQNATSQLASDLGTKMHGVISRAVSREVGKIRSRASSIDGSRRGSCCAVPSEEGKAKGPDDEPASSVRRSVPLFPPPSPASSRPPRRTSSIGRLSDGVEQWRKSKAGGREEPSPVQGNEGNRSCNSNSRSESRGEDGYFPANRTRSRRRSSSDKSKPKTRIGGAGTTSRRQSSVERVSDPGPGDALLGSSSCCRLQDESSSTHAGAGSPVLPYNYFRPGPPATCAPAVPRTGLMSPFALHAGVGQSIVYSPPVAAAPPATLFSPQLQVQQMQKYPVSAAATPPLATLHPRGTPMSSSAQPPARPGGMLVASSRARGPGSQGYDFTTRSAAGGVPPRPLPAATVAREPYQHQYHLRASGSATAAFIPTATTTGGALSSSVAQSRRTASNSIEPVTRPAPAPPVSTGQMNANGGRAATTSQKARPPRLPVSSAGAGVAVGGKSKCSTKGPRGASSSRNERVVVDASGRRASFGAPAPASSATTSAMSTRSYRTSSGTSPTESLLEGDVSKVLAFGSHSITNQNRHAGAVVDPNNSIANAGRNGTTNYSAATPSSSTWTTTSSQDLQLHQRTQTQSAAGAFLENFRQRALSIPRLSSPFLMESPQHPAVETVVGVHPRASAWPPLQPTSGGNLPTASCAEARTRKTLTRQQKSQKLDVIQQA